MAATPPRKTAPRKAPAASAAARREVRAAKAKPKPLEVKFRGETFEIPIDRLGTDAVYMRTRAMQDATEFGERLHFMGQVVRLLIGPANQDRFIALARDDERPGTLVIEMMQAINKATNVPNS